MGCDTNSNKNKNRMEPKPQLVAYGTSNKLDNNHCCYFFYIIAHFQAERTAHQVRVVWKLIYFCQIYIYIYKYKLNLQTVLFRPLRSHQCSSEWFENWDMSTVQRAINTSHTDKQWHILFLNTRVLKLKRASNA